FFFLNYGMKVFGMPAFTINLMTLLGLSLSVGVVVDDAILVLESIYRHRELGKGRKEGALLGAREITFAAIAATLSIMATFLAVWEVGLLVLLVLVAVQALITLVMAVRRKVSPPPPLPLTWPLALVVGVMVMLAGCSFRLLALWQKGLVGLVWPVLSLGEA